MAKFYDAFFNKACRLAVASLLFILILCQSVFAFGMDTDYLNPSMWQGKSNVEEIQLTSQDVDGSMGYFSQDISVSFLFNLANESITPNSTIYFEFLSDDYDLVIDENGLVDPNSDEKSSFNVQCSFSKYLNENHGDYIILMDIKDKVYTHTFDIYMTVDSRRFKLSKNVVIKTSPPPTTTKQTTAKAPKEATTKVQTSKAQNAAKVSTTKFRYVDPIESETKFALEDDVVDEDYDTAVVATQSSKSRMSTKSKVVLGIGVAVAIIGTYLIADSLIKSNKAKNKKEEADEIKDDYDF